MNEQTQAVTFTVVETYGWDTPLYVAPLGQDTDSQGEVGTTPYAAIAALCEALNQPEASRQEVAANGR
jgi:hypothetical protein